MKGKGPNIVSITPPGGSVVGQAGCEIVRLELAGGYRGYGRWWRGEQAGRAVLYLHGIQSHGGWFLRSGEYLAGQGMMVLAPDRRGSGLNQEARGHSDSLEQLVEDVDRGVDWLREQGEVEKVDIVGVSWGGKLALVYAGEQGEKVRSAVLVAPGLCPKVDISLGEKIKIGAEKIMNVEGRHEIPLQDSGLFTQVPEMIRFIENDPLKLTQATASFFFVSARMDRAVRKSIERLRVGEGKAGQERLPVYLFLAEKDLIMDNQATIDLLRPILRPGAGGQEIARIYKNAHHTLDFEPAGGREVFFKELAGCLMGTGKREH